MVALRVRAPLRGGQTHFGQFGLLLFQALFPPLDPAVLEPDFHLEITESWNYYIWKGHGVQLLTWHCRVQHCTVSPGATPTWFWAPSRMVTPPVPFHTPTPTWLLHGPLGSGSVQSIPDKRENCSLPPRSWTCHSWRSPALRGTQVPGSWTATLCLSFPTCDPPPF